MGCGEGEKAWEGRERLMGGDVRVWVARGRIGMVVEGGRE